MPDLQYSIIYVDPPWTYSDRGCTGAAAEHYATMSFASLAALPVKAMAAPDAAMLMWATFPKIEEALRLIPAWGFTFKSIGFLWIKTKGAKPFFGLGRWTRGNAEPCLLATRGHPHRVSAAVSQLVGLDGEPLEIEAPEETFDAPVTRHSAKPAIVRDRIVELMGDLPRVELFARDAAPGWDRWGNEVEPTIVPTGDGWSRPADPLADLLGGDEDGLLY